MIVLITGTPGTGKSTVSKLLSERMKFKRININEVATSDVCVGVEKGSRVVDIEKLAEKVREMIKGDIIIDGHLSHLLPFGDIVVVLRTRPKILRRRLLNKGFEEEKIRENLEAEALDACLIESLENHENVFEIDTSDKAAPEVVEDILGIIKGDTESFKPGDIDWSEEFFDVKSLKS
jgi:adenylate kinase